MNQTFTWEVVVSPNIHPFKSWLFNKYQLLVSPWNSSHALKDRKPLSCKTLRICWRLRLLRWWCKCHRGIKCCGGRPAGGRADRPWGRGRRQNFLCHVLTKECIAFLKIIASNLTKKKAPTWLFGGRCPGMNNYPALWGLFRKALYYILYIEILFFEFPSLNNQHLMKSKRVFSWLVNHLEGHPRTCKWL